MLYIFADEAGNFDFSERGSQFFIVTSVIMRDLHPAMSLFELRHQLVVEGAEIRDDGFHATDDRQAVRDRVFPIIQAAEVVIDAVVLDKRKTLPRIAGNEHYFYKLDWHFLFRHVMQKEQERLKMKVGWLSLAR